MRQVESFHRYPRPLTFSIALLAAILVALAVGNLGIVVLGGLWDLVGRDEALLSRVPFLIPVLRWIDGITMPHITSWIAFFPRLMAPLAWAAAALLVALVLRNAFPAVRTSNVGMLVEFAGTWLPLRWEDLRELRVTQDLAGEHFVILAETGPRQLTSWHRLYSLFYGLAGRPGFYVSSRIGQFDELLKTMISQSERTARALEGVTPVRVREDAQSPIFRLLLSPGAFFSRSAKGDVPSPPISTSTSTIGSTFIRAGGPVRAAYPARITVLLSGVTALLALALALSYLADWAHFLALSFPALRPVWPFSLTLSDPRYVELYNAYRSVGVPFLGVAGRPDLPAPWWLLVSAHLMLLLAAPLLLWLRGLLPALESRSDGMAVRDGGRWRIIPWERVSAFKATELSEESQILLLQSPLLPASGRLTSLLYDRSNAPGVLITSAISGFPDLLGHAVNSIAPLEEGRKPVLRQDAHSWLFWLASRRRPALAALVAEARADEATKRATTKGVLAAAAPMALLALMPALLVLTAGLLGDNPPTFRLVGAFLVVWLFGMFEWPLVSLLSVVLDENTGGGEEGYRALTLYPLSQLPRLLPMLLALVLTVVGVPVLPILAWAAAIAWAYWLTAGLVEALYEWSGSQVILGGLLPVLWQLLLLLGFLLATR
jgi:hypothetical protein